MWLACRLVLGMHGAWTGLIKSGAGLHFDKDKQLIDPWVRAVSHKRWSRKAACKPGDNSLAAMRCVVVDDRYDWEGDVPLRIRSEKAIVYELHVGGFTRHPSSKVANPGTFARLD